MTHAAGSGGSLRVKDLIAAYESQNTKETSPTKETSHIGHTGSLDPPLSPALQEKTEDVAQKVIAEQKATFERPFYNVNGKMMQISTPPPDIPLPPTPDNAMARIHAPLMDKNTETVSNLWASSRSPTASNISTASSSQIGGVKQTQVNTKINTRIDNYRKEIVKIADDRKSKLVVKELSNGNISVSTTRRLFGFFPGKSASTKLMVKDLKDLAFKALETNDPQVIGRYHNMLSNLRASPWGQSLDKNKDVKQTLDQVSKICTGWLDDPSKLDGLEAALGVAKEPTSTRGELFAARDTLTNLRIPSDFRQEFNNNLDQTIELIENKLKKLDKPKLAENFEIANKATELNNPSDIQQLRAARETLNEAKLIGPNSSSYNAEIDKHIAKIDIELRKTDVQTMKFLLLNPSGRERELLLNSAKWVIPTEDFIQPFQEAIQSLSSRDPSELTSLIQASMKLAELPPEELGKVKNNSTLMAQLETVYALALDHPNSNIAQAGEQLGKQLHRFSEENVTTQLFGRGDPTERAHLLQSMSTSPQSFVVPLRDAIESIKSSFPFHPESKEGHPYVQVSGPEFRALVEAGISLSKLPYTNLLSEHEGTSLREQLESLRGFAMGYESEFEPELTRLGRELKSHLDQVPKQQTTETPALSQAEKIGHFIDATPAPGHTVMSQSLDALAKGTLSKIERDNLLDNLTLDFHAMTGGAIVNINLNEFRQPDLSKEPTIKYATEVTNDITNKVIASIHQVDSQKETQRLIGLYVDLAERLSQENNFMAAMAIFAALNESSVGRIVDQNSKTLNAEQKEKFAQLNDLFNPAGSNKNYRIAAKAAQDKGLAIVPLINLLMSDMTFIKDGNKNVLDSKVNLNKTALLTTQEQNLRAIQESLNSETSFKTDFFKGFEPVIKNAEGQVVERRQSSAEKDGRTDFSKLTYEHSLKVFPRKPQKS